MKHTQAQTHSEVFVKPLATEFEPDEPDEVPDDADKGAALAAARDDDRAWREQRGRAMQLRLARGERHLQLASNLREWSWRCVTSGGGLLILTCLGFYAMRDNPAPGWLLLLVCGNLIVITLLGLLLLPVSKLLQEMLSLRQERWLQQAVEDQLEI